jgi:hypothetical protein
VSHLTLRPLLVGMRSSPATIVGASLVALALLISRQPSAIVHPQIFGEDGKVWFHAAYQFGPFRPLLWPYLGYLETFQRLIAGAALLLPLTLIPAFFTWVSLMVEVFPLRSWPPTGLHRYSPVVASDC